MKFPTTSGELAQMLKAELRGPADVTLSDVAILTEAGPQSLTFIRDGRHAREWAASKAAAAIVAAAATKDLAEDSRPILVVAEADLALIVLLSAIEPKPPVPAPGIHATALIDPSAKVDPSVSIGPWSVVGARTVIGPGCVLGPRISIAEDCRIGEHCDMRANVVLYPRTVIGRHVTLHAGVVLGADGFGYRPAPDKKGLIKIPHIGNVVIGDQVEVGANSCIDRAKFGSTRIGAGTKIDNLVQIGHGVQIGRAAAICAQVGIAGSVRIGDGAMLAGQVGVPDGISVGAGAIIGGQAAPTADVPSGAYWFGTPAMPARQAHSQFAFVAKLYLMRNKLYKLLEKSDNESS